VGISLGKSKVTPLDDAIGDYLTSLRALYPYGDYFAVNVSSPNTPGLRGLQDRDRLDALLAELRTVGPKPLLVKVAPDLTEAALGEVLDVCDTRGVAGLIATNTTVSRTGLEPADAARARQAGGLSGAPLTARAREVVRFVVRETGGRLPVVGVGGVLCPDDAVRLRDAGASLIQLYTGLIYRGPRLVRDCVRALSQREADRE
jgi:dihydroorotate dehydrogenase